MGNGESVGSKTISLINLKGQELEIEFYFSGWYSSQEYMTVFSELNGIFHHLVKDYWWEYKKLDFLYCKCRPSQIVCTVTAMRVTYTQTALRVHENSCPVLIPLCKNDLNLPIYFTVHYALKKIKTTTIASLISNTVASPESLQP